MRLTATFAIVASLAAAVGTARAEILIKVDKSAQRMTVVQNGEALYSWPVSTGRTGYATPSGSYTTFRMEAEHYSKEWDDAPMPHSYFSPRWATPFTARTTLRGLDRPPAMGACEFHLPTQQHYLHW
jgi:lipoprotein-anchoring transpeptidase ErfK/SrfK